MAWYQNNLTKYPDIMIEQNIFDNGELMRYDREMSYKDEPFKIGLAKYIRDEHYYSLRPLPADKTYNEDWTIIARDLPCLDFKAAEKRREELIKLIVADYKNSLETTK